MTNTTVKELHEQYPLGNAEVGDYFVGQKANDPDTTGTLNFAPTLDMDPSPTLAADLDLNGNDVIGNLRVNNFNAGIDASSTTFLRGDGTWVDPFVAGGTINSSTINYLAYYSGTKAISGTANLTGFPLGIPLSGNLSNCTGYAVANITGLGTNVDTALAIAASGSAGGFARTTSPTFTTPVLGTPTSGNLANCTGLPSSALTGLGTGVGTALAVNVGTAGAFVVNGGALGTPSSGTLTNATGLPIAGISATGTPSSGNFLRGDGTWAAPSGSGSVNSGLINQLGYYAAAGTAISGLTTANNGVLVTNGSGAPSISSTLPSGIAATNMSLTTPTMTSPTIGAATATSVTFSNTATGGIVGTTTNNNAAAGYYGEFTSSTVSSGSPVSVTTNTSTNLTSLSLTAGDWAVSGNVWMTYSGSNTVSIAWVSTSSATLPNNENRMQITATNIGGASGMAIPSTRFSLSATTTVYLSVYGTFTTGICSASGNFYARRIR